MLGLLTTKLVAVSKSEFMTAVNLRIVPYSRCVLVKNGLSEKRRIVVSGDKENKNRLKRMFGNREDCRVVSTVCRLADYKGIRRFLGAAPSGPPQAICGLFRFALCEPGRGD